MKTLRIILIVIFALILVFSCWKLIGILGEYNEGQSSYDSLEKYVSFETPKTYNPESGKINSGEPDKEGNEEPEQPQEEPDDTVWPVVDFQELAKVNPDVVAWIFIEGTNVNYPVVQGKNNSYYLNHLFDGRVNSSGAIFLDAVNSGDFSDPHSIIYGHHMNDKSMFYTLDGYKKQEFYDQYNLALLITPTHRYKIRLFSSYIAAVDGNSWQVDFEKESFEDWVQEIKESSALVSDYAPEEGDRIITFSTCSYDFYLAKLVVHGYVERVFENNGTD